MKVHARQKGPRAENVSGPIHPGFEGARENCQTAKFPLYASFKLGWKVIHRMGNLGNDADRPCQVKKKQNKCPCVPSDHDNEPDADLCVECGWTKMTQSYGCTIDVGKAWRVVRVAGHGKPVVGGRHSAIIRSRHRNW